MTFTEILFKICMKCPYADSKTQGLSFLSTFYRKKINFEVNLKLAIKCSDVQIKTIPTTTVERVEVYGGRVHLFLSQTVISASITPIRADPVCI